VPEILARIEPPTFPDRDFDITEYGAVGDREADATEAFEDAVTACHEAGGGRVVVPEGDFLSGPIHLRSNVNLHVTEGATIRFVRDPSRYLPAVYTRWEGMELMNYSPLIYAFEEENVAVMGAGTLDGQANTDYWWPWKGQPEDGWSEGEPRQKEARDRLMTMVDDGVPVEERVFGEDSYLRPSFIQPYRCENVFIEGVEIIRSPMWEIHPVLSTNVTVRGVTVESHGPNNDGCNPESCTDVLIEDCYFDTGDDCIALKSGRNEDGRRIGAPIENVIVRNCTMRDGHGGVVIGSEMSGGARNIFAEDCEMDSPNLDRILRIKTNSIRGGTVEDVYMRNIEVGEVGGSIVRVNFLYEEGDAGEHEPTVRRIDVRGINADRCERVVNLRGYEDSPIQDVTLADCRLSNVAGESTIEHVENLTLENVTVNGTAVTYNAERGTIEAI
jgi:polygalacturonase